MDFKPYFDVAYKIIRMLDIACYLYQIRGGLRWGGGGGASFPLRRQMTEGSGCLSNTFIFILIYYIEISYAITAP